MDLKNLLNQLYKNKLVFPKDQFDKDILNFEFHHYLFMKILNLGNNILLYVAFVIVLKF
jgi:hypothetical protein